MMIRFAIVGLLLLGAATAEAGRTTGPGKKIAQVQGFDLVTYKVKFTPNKPAQITVVGDGDAPLAVGVFDASGKAVTVDIRNTDNFTLRWTPTSTQPYSIKILNRGGVPTRFHLKTN